MENKIFLKSKTVWGVVIMAIPALFPLFGWTFTVDDTAVVNEAADKVFQAVGALLTLYGRFAATTTLTVK